MSGPQSSYRQIFKSISIFGGVQLFNVIISLIRGKVLAVLIGASGMGLNGLLLSGLNLIKLVSGLGLEQSAVRDISAAYGTGDEQKVNRVYTVFRRWIWFTAALGVVLTIGFSSLLSKLSFGDNSYAWSYVWLSSTFVFGALTGGIYTLLRGTQKISYLAKASVFGAAASLLAVLPVFYFLGIKGVVPALIISALVGYPVSLYFRKKVHLKTIDINWLETFSEGKSMVILGITLSVSAFLSTAFNYFLNTYIIRVGTLSDLGLYSAGLTIISGYVGMVFTAMGTDFFPRLSSIINDEVKWKELVNHQSELLVLILGPILALMLATAPILIKILLSSEFLATVDFLIWSVLAILIKGLVWVLSFVIMAKGQSKLYLLTEILANIWFLLLNMFFFNNYNIKGLGISMLVSFIGSLIMMVIIMKWKFNFVFSKSLILLSVILFIILAFSLASILWLDYPKAYFSGFFFFIIASVLSLFELNKRMELKALFINMKNKIF